MSEPIVAETPQRMKDYPMERTVLGCVVLVGMVAALFLLFFVPIPDKNVQLIPIVLTALTGGFAIIVGAVWKTSMTERQQQATIQALAASASAPLTTTTTTTTDKVGTVEEPHAGS